MKKFFLFIALLLPVFSGFSATYYFKTGATDLTDRANWGTNFAGTTGGPATGTGSGAGGVFSGTHTYIITNATLITNPTIVTLNTAWNLVATSTVQVGIPTSINEQAHLTIASTGSIPCTVTVPNAKTLGTSNLLILQSATIPTLGALGLTLNYGCTINYNAAGAQIVSNKTYYNLTLSNTGTKTITTPSVTVNNKLSMQGTAMASLAPTYGAAASLEYNTATSRNAGVEWITPFLATGGVIIDNVGVITLNSAKVFGANTNVPLNIKTGATLVTANLGLSFHGDFINTGTLTAGSSPIDISGTTSTHNIGGFTTTGQISITKTSGKALVTGNWPITGVGSFPLLINGSGGVLEFSDFNSLNTTGALNIQNGLLRLNNIEINVPLGLLPAHTHQVGSFTQTGGTLDFSDKNFNPNLNVVLNISGNFLKTAGTIQTSNSSTGGSFGLIQFNGISQNIENNTLTSLNTEFSVDVMDGSTCTLTNNFVLGTSTESFTIKPNGTLICASFVISGAPNGYFSVFPDATIKIGNANGINSSGLSGTVQTGLRYFDSGGNYEYNGTVAQNTGLFTTNPVGETVKRLIISNTASSPNNIVTGQQNFTVTKACNFNAGIFAIGAFTMTIEGTLSCTATSNFRANGLSNMVIGGNGPFGTSLFFDATNIGKSRGADANGSLGNLTPGTTNNIQNFSLNRPGQVITLGNEMQVNNNLVSTAGTIESGGNLVMLSTDAKTSSILAFGSGGFVTGDVVVQSFFKGGTVAVNRGYRMISSPTANILTFFPQIKERFIVTCAGGLAAGCDIPPTKHPSAQTLTKYLEPGLPGATSFGNINHADTMEIGRGYYFFFRGSRADLGLTHSKINEPFDAPEDWTAAFTGPINYGNILVPVTRTATADVANDGLNLVGNPYPSVLNFNTFRNDVSNSMVLDDFFMIMKRDRSGFFSYSAGILSSGSLSAIESAGAAPGTAQFPYIQPCQAFFVRKNNSNASPFIFFKEAYKAGAANTKNALRTLEKNSKQGLGYPAIRQLIQYNIKSNESQDYATIVLEDGNMVNYCSPDAPYMANNTIFTYSLTSDGIPSSINFMPAVADVNEIKLFVESSKSDANLKLNFTELIGAGNKEIWLKDNYTQTSTQITCTNNSYNFGIDKSIKETSGKDRFVLVFKTKDVLPITLTNFTAKASKLGGQLNWETKTEINAAKFEVQSTVDGVHFTTLKIVDTKATNGNSTHALTYNYLDKTIQSGTIYYRLKMIDKDGAFAFSDLRTAHFNLKDTNTVVVYPNPVKEELNISWYSKNNQTLSLIIHDLSGKVIKNFTSVKGHHLKTNVSFLQSGVYILKLKDQKTHKVLAISKFIKE